MTGPDMPRGAAPMGRPPRRAPRQDLAEQPTGRVRFCPGGLGLSLESDLLAQAAAEGRPLDAAQLDRVVYGQCVEERPLGEVRR